jgi:hypothetical protein
MQRLDLKLFYYTSLQASIKSIFPYASSTQHHAHMNGDGDEYDDRGPPSMMRVQSSMSLARPPPGPACVPGRKLTQAEAGYVAPPGVPFKCGTCMHFGGPVARTCGIVRGPVDIEGCCNEWERPEVPRQVEHASGRDVEDIVRRRCLPKASEGPSSGLKF